MANIKEIKSRMKSIKETKQITKAMKLISAAKLKKARDMLEHTRPFFNKVKETMADILQHSGDIKNIYFDVRNSKDGKKKAYVVLTGDKGLAGGYNSNIIKAAEKQINSDKESLLLVAGHVGKNHFMKKDYNVFESFDFPVQNPTVYRAKEISEIVLDLFKKGTVDEVYMVFTMMESSIKVEPHVMKLLPLELESLRNELNLKTEKKVVIDDSLMYEPSPQAVLNYLVPKYVKGIIYGCLVEAFTSEQNARMIAMDNATKNAEDMLKKLHLFYNRARQAAITQEISEIVGGASVLD